jgi:hypothetical protein
MYETGQFGTGTYKICKVQVPGFPFRGGSFVQHGFTTPKRKKTSEISKKN